MKPRSSDTPIPSEDHQNKSSNQFSSASNAEVQETFGSGKDAFLKQSVTARILVACGAVGPLLFLTLLLIEGATRPDYSAWHHFGSLLTLGEQGWMQITNFIVCGVLVLCFAIGLRLVLRSGKGATWGSILLGLFGLGLVAVGFFVTDPVAGQGYPPGGAITHTLHGRMHDLFTLLMFISLPVACFVLARRFAGDPAWRGWALYSVVTGILVFVFFEATSIVATNLHTNDATVGLLQRISMFIGWGWISLFALQLLCKKGPRG